MEIFESCKASGGGVQLSVVEANKLLYYYSNYFNFYQNAYDLEPLAYWVVIPINKANISFNEQPIDNHATAYNCSLSLFVLGNEISNIKAFEQLNGKQFVLDFTDNNDNRRVIGFKDQALRLTIEFNVPDSVTNLTGHILTFSGIVSKRAQDYII